MREAFLLHRQEFAEFVNDMRERLVRIEDHASHTNGSVAELNQWMWFVKGVMAAAALVGSVYLAAQGLPI
jgi:hypothetical protein